MSYAIAAAGTGGHVYPGLAVAEALVERGVAQEAIVFFGGDRLEKSVYPREGFAFVELRLQALRRSLSPSNLKIPLTVYRAMRRANAVLRDRNVRSVLAMGSYVTIPVGWAAHRAGVPLLLHEQNAVAGLGNRAMARWATDTFAAVEGTRGFEGAVVVGTPVRAMFSRPVRRELRAEALQRYGIDPGGVVIGILGGSLGAGVLNMAARRLAHEWAGPPVRLLHLAGGRNIDAVDTTGSVIPWVALGYEDQMEYFYAACDIVISRAGGVAVAELAATHTPSVLIPGGFGGGHQRYNAAAMAKAGAAVVLAEDRMEELVPVVRDLVADAGRRRAMAEAAQTQAHADAAGVLADRMMQAHG